MYNRRKRNETNQDLKEEFERKYQEAKDKVHLLVYESMTTFEYDMRKQIEEEKNPKKVWKYIDALRKGGKRKKDSQVTVIL